MPLSHEQQAIDLITRSRRILLVTRDTASVDAQAAIAALFRYLKKQNKELDAVIPGLDANAAPHFLPALKDVRPALGAMRALFLTLDVSKAPFSELSYDVKNGKLEIGIVPQSGEWSPKDLTFRHGEDRYDLIIALDTPDLASLGSSFRDHADFFYRTPVITIDRDPGHEHWGQVNLVDLTAVSTTEVLFGMFERWNRNLIDEEISTALLAGMIAKTQSFRTSNVTPKTLQISSQLVAMGAEREQIVHGLWRTRTIPMLKVWGRALSRLEQDMELGIVWTMLARQDYIETGAGEDALTGIVNELVTYSPEAKVIILVYEKEDAHTKGACVSIHTVPPFSAQELGRAFGANGNRDRVEFCLTPGTPLLQGTQMVVEHIRQILRATAKR